MPEIVKIGVVRDPVADIRADGFVNPLRARTAALIEDLLLN